MPPSSLVKLGVTLAAGEIEHVRRHQCFECARDRLVIGANQERLSHVPDIEEPGLVRTCCARQ